MPTVLAGVTQDITIAFHASETLPTGLPSSMGFMLAKDEKGVEQFHAKDLARIDLINRVRAAGLEIDEETLRITFYKDDWSGPFGAYEDAPGKNRPAYTEDIDTNNPKPMLGSKIYTLGHKTYTATTISFEDGVTKEIRDSANGLAQFITGENVVVSGSVSNNGTYTIATGGVAGTIVTTAALTDEVAGASITLTVVPVASFADIIDFGGKTYLTAGGRVYQVQNWGTPGSSWLLSVYSTSAADGYRFHVHNGYLYLCCGTQAAYAYTADGTSWTASNRGGTDQQASEMSTLRGILHKRVNQNHYQLSAATSTGINGGETWSSADQIGDTSYSLGRMLVASDSIVFAAINGLLGLDGEGNVLDIIPGLKDISGRVNSSACKAWLNQFIYVPLAEASSKIYSDGRVEQVSHMLQVERTLGISQMAAPPLTEDIFSTALAGDRLYGCQNYSTNSRILSLEFTSKGFSWKVVTVDSAANYTSIYGVYVTDTGGAGPILFADKAVSTARIRYWIIPIGPDATQDSRSRFAASGIIYDPWLTLGCPEVNKRWSHIEVAVTQSTPANFAKTTYTCDAINEAGSDVITTNSLTMAEGITIGTISFNSNTISRRARLVHTLANTGASQELETPILLWIRVYAYALPTPQRRFDMLLNISSENIGGGIATQVQARQFLDTISGAQLPLTLTDMYGTSWTVNPSKMGVEEFLSGRDYNDYDEMYRLVLIEQTAGV